MTKLIKSISAKQKKIQNIIWIVLICSFFTTSLSYVFFTGVTASKTANRNQNTAKLKELNRDFQEAESIYLSLISNINLDYAYSIGFTGENKKSFVNRKTTVANR